MRSTCQRMIAVALHPMLGTGGPGALLLCDTKPLGTKLMGRLGLPTQALGMFSRQLRLQDTPARER